MPFDRGDSKPQYKNKNRKKIETVVSNSNNIRCLIFNFGQVDLYFSYYYAKFIQNKRLSLSLKINIKDIKK